MNRVKSKIKIKFKCNLCDFKSLLFMHMQEHIFSNHPKPVKCILDKYCLCTYKSVAAFRRHCRDKHAELNMKIRKINSPSNKVLKDRELVTLSNKYDFLVKENSNSSGPDLRTPLGSPTEDESIENNHFDSGTDMPNPPTTDESVESNHFEFIEMNEINDIWKEKMEDFSQILQSEFKINANCLNFIFSSLSEFSEFTYEQGMKNRSNIIGNHAKRLKSSYLRGKIFGSMETYVGPESILLTLKNDFNVITESGTIEYIPIKKTITNLIKYDTDIQNNIVNGNNSSNNNEIIKDFTDGSLFKNNEVLKRPRTALIQLYIDEFQVNNPLRSYGSKTSLTGVYFRLLNKPPHLRSTLHSVKLIMIFKTGLVKPFGYEKIFSVLIQDLKDLHVNGIEVKINEETLKVFGALCHIASDNLGAQKLGGFMESAATRFCRNCLISKGERNNSNVDLFPRRTKEEYLKQLEAVKDDPSKQKEYGIKNPCPFMELEYFSTLDGFPPCIHHDLLEGTIHDVIKYLVNYLSINKVIDAEEFKNLIDRFPYTSIDIPNKPTKMKIDAKDVKGTAGKTHVLLRLLGLIIGPKVKDNHIHSWKIYLVLREMTDIIFSFELTKELINSLPKIVKDFQELYVKLKINNGNMKPKVHYLSHYADEIMRFGPLPLVGTMRFESKHLVFKQIHQASNNRINPCLSMAKKNSCIESLELQRAYSSDTDFRFMKQKKLSSREILLYEQTLKKEFRSEIDIVDFDFFETVKINNFDLHEYNVFPIQSTKKGRVSLFGLIIAFFRYESKCYLYFQLLKDFTFNSHLHSYEFKLDSFLRIKEGDTFGIMHLEPKKLEKYEFSPIYYVDSHWYASMKRINNVNM